MPQHLPPPAFQLLPRAPRVLLVDDEAPVLRALLRVLKSRRPAWEVASADRVFAAVELLRGRCFDVLLTDLSMPEATGRVLLEYSIRHCPAMARVLHSGSLGVPEAEDVTPLCDLVLNKPVLPEALVEALDSAVALSDGLLGETTAGKSAYEARSGSASGHRGIVARRLANPC